MPTFDLTSPAFEDGEAIPDRYGYTEQNINPPLVLDDVPPAAESVALAMDDPDAMEPAGKIWDHWVVWNILPDRGQIPEGWDPAEAVEGANDYGENGYGGPKPPDRVHTYRFIASALDTTLDLPPGSSKADLESAMEGHVIEQAELEGTYAP